MQTPNPNPPKTETGSAPPERGRVWRIVIIVLALHAALLGSVVLIQGCGSKEPAAVTVNDALDSSRSVDGQASTAAVKEDTNSVSNAGIICPSADILTPEEKLPASNETPPGDAPNASPAPSTIIAQTEAPKAETELPKVEAPLAESPVAAPPASPKPAPAAAPATRKYTVCKGDTLSRIAKKNGVTLRELTDLNKISTGTPIRSGQKLLIPANKAASVALRETPAVPKTTVARAEKKAAAPAAAAKRKSTRPLLAARQTHVVKPGESLYKIAQRYGVSTQSLMKVNQISDPRKIRVSQKLIVPSPAARSASAKAPARTDSGIRMVSNKPPVVDEEADVAAPIETAPSPEPPKAAAKPAAEPADLGEEVEGT